MIIIKPSYLCYKSKSMEGKADYIAFMQWFQKNHSELYTCCCYSITAPVDGEGVTVDKDGLDPETYKAVIKATEDFYRDEHK